MTGTSTKPTSRRRGRPPGASAGYSETRETLIRAGLAFLTEYGFSAVGIDEILRSVQVPKGSFYHYFESKDAFGLVLVEAYGTYFAHKLDRCFSKPKLTPIRRLKHFVKDAKVGMERFDFRRGCLIGNLGQEIGALSEPFRDKLIGVLRDWQHRTAACLEEAKAAGEIDRNEDCEALAAQFWIGWEGAVLRAKLERSAEPLEQFAAGFFAGLTLRHKK